ncbi:hypothetical protein CROQUDRAFT_89442 [Cronartium quercuum f. sp. fusiforme G11]|uniref:Uncharacterized protein n=1 Tax=Cronartium quercuum f. sp. fusiforme G11 TaxID=708437 RepID=A0A9P6NRR0_9BASI|nr:hypothetical protein CROQUDRAFT_89442 [Cronartium quercuum f. sp. fusiforme G11]
MDLRGGWRVKPQTLICTPHRLRYTIAPNPHSTLSHSPIAPPYPDRTPHHPSFRPTPNVSPYSNRVMVGLSSPTASEV